MATEVDGRDLGPTSASAADDSLQRLLRSLADRVVLLTGRREELALAGQVWYTRPSVLYSKRRWVVPDALGGGGESGVGIGGGLYRKL